ncbi:uncharacterized protein LAESUDRAFT_727250 [Laetiporus sulphureus 93-53]|uniref:Uncharacterized protein n=1 Tax=Laetiporus sulphureus 93-53 TaxID=1314785 RepID=A0A165DNT5_9APHY|nr:uncharacterized protein LAESUDRAFT_727250 [Laetiporus sulphureus 93-53]KZT05293.1 hypothetical protein LAESUDRAFT_727250 [Laetiporus sulphureus 93-53]
MKKRYVSSCGLVIEGSWLFFSISFVTKGRCTTVVCLAKLERKLISFPGSRGPHLLALQRFLKAVVRPLPRSSSVLQAVLSSRRLPRILIESRGRRFSLCKADVIIRERSFLTVPILRCRDAATSLWLIGEVNIQNGECWQEVQERWRFMSQQTTSLQAVLIDELVHVRGRLQQACRPGINRTRRLLH